MSEYINSLSDTPDLTYINIVKKYGYPIAKNFHIKDYNPGDMIIGLNTYGTEVSYIPYDDIEDILEDLDIQGLNPTFCELYTSEIHDKIKFIGDIDIISNNAFYDEDTDDKILNYINKKIAPLFDTKIHIATSHGIYYTNKEESNLDNLENPECNINDNKKIEELKDIDPDLTIISSYGEYGIMNYESYYEKYYILFTEIIQNNDKYLKDMAESFINEYNQYKYSAKLENNIYNSVLDLIIRDYKYKTSDSEKIRKCYKYSYHIIADQYFSSIDDIANFVKERKLDSVLDMYIYSKERKIRLPLCIKGYDIGTHYNDKRILKIHTPYSKISDFFITKPDNDDLEYLIKHEKKIKAIQGLEKIKSHHFIKYIMNTLRYFDNPTDSLLSNINEIKRSIDNIDPLNPIITWIDKNYLVYLYSLYINSHNVIIESFREELINEVFEKMGAINIELDEYSIKFNIK